MQELPYSRADVEMYHDAEELEVLNQRALQATMQVCKGMRCTARS